MLKGPGQLKGKIDLTSEEGKRATESAYCGDRDVAPVRMLVNPPLRLDSDFRKTNRSSQSTFMRADGLEK